MKIEELDLTKGNNLDIFIEKYNEAIKNDNAPDKPPKSYGEYPLWIRLSDVYELTANVDYYFTSLRAEAYSLSERGFVARWIPVSEDVPPKGIEVLAVVTEGKNTSKARMMFTDDGWIMLEEGRSEEFFVHRWIKL